MRVWTAVVFLMCVPPTDFRAHAQEGGASPRPTVQQLEAIVEELKGPLSISATVVVSIVPSEQLMVSVQAPTEPGAPFRLAIEASFLDVLTEAEVRAAIAHELGHVWVFTHHPFLQTEELANRMAMRAVSRETLERVYEKVWKRVGTKGDLALFFGDEATAGLASESQPH